MKELGGKKDQAVERGVECGHLRPLFRIEAIAVEQVFGAPVRGLAREGLAHPLFIAPLEAIEPGLLMAEKARARVDSRSFAQENDAGKTSHGIRVDIALALTLAQKLKAGRENPEPALFGQERARFAAKIAKLGEAKLVHASRAGKVPRLGRERSSERFFAHGHGVFEKVVQHEENHEEPFRANLKKPVTNRRSLIAR